MGGSTAARVPDVAVMTGFGSGRSKIVDRGLFFVEGAVKPETGFRF